LSINKICDAVKQPKKEGECKKKIEEEVPIPTFGEAFASFEAV
jgi:hypothetical protein